MAAIITSGLYNKETGKHETFNPKFEPDSTTLPDSTSTTPNRPVADEEDWGNVTATISIEHASPADQDTANDALNYIKKKAADLIACEDQIEETENQLKILKEQQRKLRLEELPQIMFEQAMTSIGVLVGNHNVIVQIEPLVNASLPKDPDRRAKALQWLVDNQLGGNIKRNLEVELPKGNEVMEHLVIDALSELGLEASIDATVHHSTYSSLCRKLVESEKIIPKDVLGIYVANIARVIKE